MPYANSNKDCVALHYSQVVAARTDAEVVQRTAEDVAADPACGEE